MPEIFTHRDPNAVPDEVSNVQGRVALKMYGLEDAVQAHISAITDADEREIAQRAFDVGNFSRNSPTLNKVADELGVPEATRDAMFRMAKDIIV